MPILTAVATRLATVIAMVLNSDSPIPSPWDFLEERVIPFIEETILPFFEQVAASEFAMAVGGFFGLIVVLLLVRGVAAIALRLAALGLFLALGAGVLDVFDVI